MLLCLLERAFRFTRLNVALCVSMYKNWHYMIPVLSWCLGWAVLFYASAVARWRGCVYVLQRFLFFPSATIVHKYETTFSGMAEQIFMKLLPNDSGENGVSITVPKWGLGPQIIFWGLKTTQCTLLHVGTGAAVWRMTQMLVRYCTAVALKRHERVNAFNLVLNISSLGSLSQFFSQEDSVQKCKTTDMGPVCCELLLCYRWCKLFFDV